MSAKSESFGRPMDAEDLEEARRWHNTKGPGGGDIEFGCKHHPGVTVRAIIPAEDSIEGWQGCLWIVCSVCEQPCLVVKAANRAQLSDEIGARAELPS